MLKYFKIRMPALRWSTAFQFLSVDHHKTSIRLNSYMALFQKTPEELSVHAYPIFCSIDQTIFLLFCYNHVSVRSASGQTKFRAVPCVILLKEHARIMQYLALFGEARESPRIKAVKQKVEWAQRLVPALI